MMNVVRSLSFLLLFGALSAIGGCSCASGPQGDDAGGPRRDAAIPDSPACVATCVRSASAPCECQLPCSGHTTTSSCTAHDCQCAHDGTPTTSFVYTTCSPSEFIDNCVSHTADAGTDAAIDSAIDGGHDGGTDAAVPLPTYVPDTRMITSSGVSRSFLLVTPSDIASRAGLPLVFSLHGDGGTGAGMRTALPLESFFATAHGAVFVYPNAPGGSFEYYTYDGRTREAQFVTDVIAALHTELAIDTTHVYVAGFSGGATMANALGCRLGPSVVRGLGLHSGTLYPVTGTPGPDFTYTASGGVSCTLPAAIFVWGQDDATTGVSFTDGTNVRDNYLATASCAATTTAGPLTPCVTYASCAHGVAWCPIAGMGHAIWPDAAHAMSIFFTAIP